MQTSGIRMMIRGTLATLGSHRGKAIRGWQVRGGRSHTARLSTARKWLVEHLKRDIPRLAS